MVNDVWSVKWAFVLSSVFLNNSEIILIPRKEQRRNDVKVLGEAECSELIQSSGRLLMLRGEFCISCRESFACWWQSKLFLLRSNTNSPSPSCQLKSTLSPWISILDP